MAAFLYLMGLAISCLEGDVCLADRIFIRYHVCGRHYHRRTIWHCYDVATASDIRTTCLRHIMSVSIYLDDGVLYRLQSLALLLLERFMIAQRLGNALAGAERLPRAA